MTRRRFEDWPMRLDAWLAAAEDRGFDWAEHNCGLFAAGAVRAMTGEDIGAPYRGTATRERAYARMRRICGGGVEAAMTAALGPPQPNVLRARRGDVVLACLPEETLGVVDLDGRQAVFLTPNGATRVALRACLLSWRV